MPLTTPPPTLRRALSLVLALGAAGVAGCSADDEAHLPPTTGPAFFTDGVPEVGSTRPTIEIDVWFLDTDGPPPTPTTTSTTSTPSPTDGEPTDDESADQTTGEGADAPPVRRRRPGGFVAVRRTVVGGEGVSVAATAQAAVAHVFAGPTPTEVEQGLVLAASGSTGAATVDVVDGTATVALSGRCAPDPDTRVTIADHLIHTLAGIEGIDVVVVLAPTGMATTTTVSTSTSATSTTTTTVPTTTATSAPTTTTTLVDTVPTCLRPAPATTSTTTAG